MYSSRYFQELPLTARLQILSVANFQQSFLETADTKNNMEEDNTEQDMNNYENTRLRENIGELEQYVQVLLSETKSLKNQIKVQKEKDEMTIKRLEKNLKFVKDQIFQDLNKMMEEENALIKQQADVVSDLRIKLFQRQDYQGKYYQKRKEFRQKEQQFQQLKKRNQELESLIRELEKGREKQFQQLKEKNQELELYIQKLKRRREKQLQGMKKKNQELSYFEELERERNQQMQGLKQQIENLKIGREKQIKKLKKRLEIVQKQKQQLSEQLHAQLDSNLEIEREKQKKRFISLEEQRKKLEQQNIRLKQQQKKSQSRFQKLKQINIGLVNQLEKLGQRSRSGNKGSQKKEKSQNKNSSSKLNKLGYAQPASTSVHRSKEQDKNNLCSCCKLHTTCRNCPRRFIMCPVCELFFRPFD